jgi:hypothetical protein
MKTHWMIGCLTLFLLSCAQCQSTKITDEKTGRAAGAQKDGPSGYYYDDVARYLGGFDLPTDSKLIPFTQHPEYQQHKEMMGKFWKKVYSHSIDPITSWRNSTLNQSPQGQVCRQDRPAIYPLCGADIINLYTLCPNASEYIMVALEKAGDIPRPDKASTRYFRGLRATRDVMFNIADRNYFSSTHMKYNLNANEEVPGIAPVLLAFTSGLGWRIVDMEKIYVSPDGKIVGLDNDNLDFKPRGVRIWFRTPDDNRLRSLTYIEQYLNAQSADTHHPLYKLMREKSGGFMLFKAASYVMHNPSMLPVRDMFLQNPDYVVQDDSGFRYMDLVSDFDVNVYGYYRAPVRLGDAFFQRYKDQPELAALYMQRKPVDLPFNFGYGSLRRPPRSNLLLAHRKQKH